MKKQDLQELARLGVRHKLEAMQDYLADLFAEFPAEFSGQTPPVFLAPQTKPDGNNWPSFTASLSSENGAKDKSAAYAARQRMLNRSSSDEKWGTVIWHRIHDYLLKQPKRAASPKQMCKALKVEHSAVTSALARHTDRIKRIGRSTYRLVKPVTEAERVKVLHQNRTRKHKPQRSYQPWGTYHWQNIHDYLLTKDDRTAGVSELMKALKIQTAASAITSMMAHKNLFRRSAYGTYQLIAEAPAELRAAK